MVDIDFLLQRRIPFLGSECSLEEAKFVVFGVPYDLTSSFRPGSRYGPEAVRKFSANIEANSYRVSRDLLSTKIFDAGDVVFDYRLPKMLRRVYAVVKGLAEAGKIPIMLGGEHSFTYASFKALADKASCLVVLDAHFDLRDEYIGLKMNHATYLRRLVEKFPSKPVVVVGVRGYDLEEQKTATNHNVSFVKASEINDWARVLKVLNERIAGGRPYVSIDIDVVDPGFAPGVGNPEPEGITPTQLLNIVSYLGAKKPVGFDVMESNPLFDSGATAALAAKTVFEILAAYQES